jgi:AccI restriction endonuclease
MTYFDKITELTKEIPASLVDFSTERTPARIPTQVSSNFITNKQQGDWAEELIFFAINKTLKNYVAVRYGKSDDLIAGDDGFSDFFQKFQDELDTIGKRPDLLVFKKSDFNFKLGYDISSLPHNSITEYVKKAVAGLEIRSSAFLIEQYEIAMNKRTRENEEIALKLKDRILSDYSDLLVHPNKVKYISILKSINADTIQALDFKSPGWYANDRLSDLSGLFKELKTAVKEIQKRNFLSITPKVEDIKVVYKWIETFDVPHFYFQVFFDKVYGISFEQILEFISDPDNEGTVFSVEKDNKNQNKTTIKINSKRGVLIAKKVEEPEHKSVRKEMARGRLLFYVTFEGGKACLDVENLIKILGIKRDEF